jgi:hypothetical protein
MDLIRWGASFVLVTSEELIRYRTGKFHNKLSGVYRKFKIYNVRQVLPARWCCYGYCVPNTGCQNRGPDGMEPWLVCMCGNRHKGEPMQMWDEGLAICWNSPASVESFAVVERGADELKLRYSMVPTAASA